VRPAIFLFDIDGTLISSGGAGRRAVENAFERLHGRREACHGFSFAGMTDRAIVRRALVGLGMPERGPRTEAAIDELLDAYLAMLDDEVRGASYRVHRGIVEALDALERLGQVAIGLGTGNVERGARIKLGPVGLDARFAFGGFGSDAEDRAELLRIGAERGATRLDRALAECRVVVIGDTPRDVEAARAIGARSIAVATGPFSVENLRASGADATFDDLSAPGALDALLD
jgi:phosphoglycolate phosphatase-like HAD superfamily hydrolase